MQLAAAQESSGAPNPTPRVLRACCLQVQPPGGWRSSQAVWAQGASEAVGADGTPLTGLAALAVEGAAEVVGVGVAAAGAMAPPPQGVRCANMSSSVVVPAGRW